MSRRAAAGSRVGWYARGFPVVGKIKEEKHQPFRGLAGAGRLLYGKRWGAVFSQVGHTGGHLAVYQLNSHLGDAEIESKTLTGWGANREKYPDR